jgi:hypothetical protein
VHERLQGLKAEVHNLEVLPAAAIRARGRGRRRRQLTALTAAGAVVATAGIAFAWPHQRTVPITDGPASSPGVSCVLTLPASPSELQVRVLDGGASAGLLDTTVAQLRARRFTVLNGTTGHNPEPAAALRYGPTAIGAATVLRAALLGDIAMVFDPDRRDEAIDLTLGPTFTGVATPTEMNRNLAAAGAPAPPPQCSPAPGR